MPAMVKANTTYSGYEGFFLNGSTFEVATIARANELASRGLVTVLRTWGSDSEWWSGRLTESVYNREFPPPPPGPGTSPTPAAGPAAFNIQITDEAEVVNPSSTRTEPPQAGKRGEMTEGGGQQQSKEYESTPSQSFDIRFTGEGNSNENQNSGQGNSPVNQAGAVEDLESAQFEEVVQDLGNDWYMLPNGERVQGKETAKSLFKAYVKGGE